MRRSTGLTRSLLRITAIVQLVLPWFVTVADARLERAAAISARSSGHVESGTRNDCAPGHTPDCALCQHLSSALAKPAKAALPIAVNQSADPIGELCVPSAALAVDRPDLPRAPPVT